MVIVKNVISNVVVPLTHNVSFNSRVFPSKMKNAKVIPIYKNLVRKNCLLFSKILEQLHHSRLDKCCVLINIVF